MRLVVLMGGWGAEREVSLVSGRAMADACRRLGHETIELDLGQERREGATLAARLADAAPDLVVNALHGVPGEDGTVQGLLALAGLPHTHSGVAASAIAIDKQLTKRLLGAAGIPVPGGGLVRSASLFEADPLPRPYVLKPNAEGSSVGVVIVEAGGPLGQPIDRRAPGPWAEFDELLAEPFVPGRELTVAVLDGDHGPEALAVTELKPRRGFYDYDAKYTEGLTEHHCPADVPDFIAGRLLDASVEAHRLLGCRGVSRVDWRWDDSRGRAGLFALEINTQPGMTPLSLVPEQAAFRGIDFDQLVARLVAHAWRPL